MKKNITLVIVCFFLTLSGFAAGYWYCDTHPAENAMIEDYALSNVFNELAYLGYLNADKKEYLRNFIDVNLDMHIKYIRNYQGQLIDDEFINSKIIILNRAAIFCERNPPFQSDEYKPNDKNSFWIHEWQTNHQKNLELLQWAKNQCSLRPDINCKNQRKSNKN